IGPWADPGLTPKMPSEEGTPDHWATALDDAATIQAGLVIKQGKVVIDGLSFDGSKGTWGMSNGISLDCQAETSLYIQRSFIVSYTGAGIIAPGGTMPHCEEIKINRVYIKGNDSAVTIKAPPMSSTAVFIYNSCIDSNNGGIITENANQVIASH